MRASDPHWTEIGPAAGPDVVSVAPFPSETAPSAGVVTA